MNAPLTTRELIAKWEALKSGGYKEKALWAQVQEPMTTLICCERLIKKMEDESEIEKAKSKLVDLRTALTQSLN